MIKNNSLSDILNDYKNNKNTPTSQTSTPPQIEQSQSNAILEFLYTLAIAFGVVFKGAVYGYTLKILLATDWTFLSTACVGLSIHFLLTYFQNLIHNK